MIQQAISKLIGKVDLTEEESMHAMNCIMEGQATQAQIAGFLTALRMKGETIAEITGCARCMREKAERIHPAAGYCIDTCGTGGDGADTFNISTASAIVAAAGGVHVAKHGNRAVSSRCGSADVLEALGVNILLEPADVEKCIEQVGIGFLFARNHHKCMKHAATPRNELGIRTIFNILGPLTNPAGAQGQVLGVFDENLTEVLAGVLCNLGTENALVVHGMDGLDEITTTDATKITEVKYSQLSTRYITPEEYGLKRAEKAELAGGDAATNAEIITSIFCGEKGPQRDIVLLNAAAAFHVGRAAKDMQEGLTLAAGIIDTGRAAQKLAELRSFTQGLGGANQPA